MIQPLVARARLAREVYEMIYRATHSFELDHVGEDVAYLMGAILKGKSTCEWGQDRRIVYLLQRAFSTDHPVWRYCVVVDDRGVRVTHEARA